MKLAAPFIFELLTYLLNLCVDNCVFPQCMKFAKVIPVYKKSDYGNYNPVSILPVLSKIFEMLLNKQVIEYFESHGLFLGKPSIFRPN